MEYICLDDDRLSYKQCHRLIDILSYIQSPRPELEWRGKKRESVRMSDSEWKCKLSNTLYSLYRDLYPTDVFTRSHVDDFFDDEYVDSLLSPRIRLARWCSKVRKFFGCCRTPKTVVDGHDEL